MSSPDRSLRRGPRLHFSGIAGSGMSALAQYHVLTGGAASGSDRIFDQGGGSDVREHLETLGVRILPQDGSGPADCDAVVASGAVEPSVEDIRMAQRRGIPVLHRAELLLRFTRERRTIAVAGTSGKSTVAAMVFEILCSAGRDPSLITGGPLLSLQAEGRLGNAWGGGSDLLVVEADESDGSLTLYTPWVGVILNIHRDHEELDRLVRIFGVFAAQTRGAILVGEDVDLEALRSVDPDWGDESPAGEHGEPGLESRDAVVFGLGPTCHVRAEEVETSRDGSRFVISGTRFTLPVLGLHNVRNAVGAVAAAQAAGVSLKESAEALADFGGVARRFQIVGQAGGIEVVDDFAHNPGKIKASLQTAQARSDRVLAVYQIHGFGPARFQRQELTETFAATLRPGDRLWMPEIYYAGGSVARDISSRDIIHAVAAKGILAFFVQEREELVKIITADAEAGDIILVMGARDPTLSGFCRRILEQLREGETRRG